MSAKRSIEVSLRKGQSQRSDFWEFASRTEAKTGATDIRFGCLPGIEYANATGYKGQLKRCLDFWLREGVIGKRAYQEGLSQIRWDPARDRLRPRRKRRIGASRRPRCR